MNSYFQFSYLFLSFSLSNVSKKTFWEIGIWACSARSTRVAGAGRVLAGFENNSGRDEREDIVGFKDRRFAYTSMECYQDPVRSLHGAIKPLPGNCLYDSQMNWLINMWTESFYVFLEISFIINVLVFSSGAIQQINVHHPGHQAVCHRQRRGATNYERRSHSQLSVCWISLISRLSQYPSQLIFFSKVNYNCNYHIGSWQSWMIRSPSCLTWFKTRWVQQDSPNWRPWMTSIGR